MAIEGLGSSSSAAQLFQPRPPQQTNTGNGTDNRAVLEQDNARPAAPPPDQQQSAQQVAQAQTQGAVIQPRTSDASERPGTAAAQTFQEFVAQKDEPQGPAQRPEAGQNNGSALNYSANGAANSPNNPGQAGRLVSLSV